MTGTVSVRRQKVQKNNIKRRLLFFLLLAGLLMLAVVFAEQICPYDPNAQIFSTLEPPSAAHPAGTDRFGRDMLSRILVGLQTSVLSTLTLVVMITVAGTIIGVLCGHLGGMVDAFMMRVSDVCLAFPGLVFAMAIAALLNGGLQNAVIALAVIGVAAGAAWWGYGQVFGSGDVWYAQVDGERLSAAGENNNGFDYHYDLPAVSETGETQTVGFDTSRELRDGAYLKLEMLALRGVVRWEEVTWDNIPAAAQAHLSS